jgi:hypothetical protein
MIKHNLYAFATGFYLALLQFSYFMILQINISSTYLTYMTVVVSWMLGAMIGLWWHALKPGLVLLAGIASYYGIYLLVIFDPLSDTTFLLAAAGVFVTGMWGGRFFLEWLTHFRRMDAIFFHENNGFLLGTVALFIGFTSLGRNFLLLAPGISGIVLLPALLRRPDILHESEEPAA